MQLEPRPCLRDELFLLAHKPNGVERVHRPSLSLALAAATLVDLQLWGRISVWSDQRLRVLSVRPTLDAIGDTALEYLNILERREHRDLRTALHHIGNEIYDRTCAWNQVAERVAKRVTTRWIGKNTERYHHTHAAAGHAGWLQAMLYYSTQVGQRVDLQSAALCALVAVLRLERQLINVNVSDAELRRALAAPLAALPTGGDLTDGPGDALRWIVAAADERISMQAVSVMG